MARTRLCCHPIDAVAKSAKLNPACDVTMFGQLLARIDNVSAVANNHLIVGQVKDALDSE